MDVADRPHTRLASDVMELGQLRRSILRRRRLASIFCATLITRSSTRSVTIWSVPLKDWGVTVWSVDGGGGWPRRGADH